LANENNKYLKKFGLKIRYHGGDAKNEQIDFYDGSRSINGLSQALQIAIHAYVKNEATSRATALKGARVFLKPARKGSYPVELVTLI